VQFSAPGKCLMPSNRLFDISRVNESPRLSPCMVYYEGMCPVRSREIAAYRQLHGSNAINRINAPRCDATQLSAGLG